MKGNELIEKILNKEIKSGTLIKMKSNYPELEWEKTLCFNGNWFSEEKYYPGVPRYDDIILHLCNEYIIFEIIEEKEIPEKLDLILDEHFTNDELQSYIYETQEKVNQVIDYLDYLKSKGDE